MEQSDTFIVAREAWKFLMAALAAYIVFLLTDLELLQFAAFAAAAVTIYIYRNPERIVPYYQNGSIVAFADGRVAAIETVDGCSAFEGPCYRVDIVSSAFDVSLLRAPFEAVVRRLKVRRGSRLSSHSALARKLNETALVQFEDEKGQRCAIEHMLDTSIDALSLHVHHEQRLMQGSRYGLLVRGRHSLYLPAASRVAVKVGDEVRAGQTLIGYFS